MVLARCLGALAVASDPEELLDRLLPRLGEWLGARQAWASRSDPDGTRRVIAALDPALIGTAVPEPSVEGGWGQATMPDGAGCVVVRCGDPAQETRLLYITEACGSECERTLAVVQPILEEAFARASEHARLRSGLAGRQRAEAEAMRRQTEAVQQHKMDAVAQLAAGMAHEINSPLQFAVDNLRFIDGAMTTLVGATTHLLQRLESHDADGGLRKYCEEIDLDFLVAEAPRAAAQCREGLDRVAALVETLKRFGSDNSGQAAPADINEAIGHTLQICAGMLPGNVEVRRLLGELPPVTCRIAEIRQILVAIIRNAVQAIADRGGVSGTIVISTLAGPESVQIAIEDDGCGMDADVAARACEPFFTTRPVGAGVGQGLAIADDVVRRHGGRMEIVSEPGAGTRIGLILPISGPPRQPS